MTISGAAEDAEGGRRPILAESVAVSLDHEEIKTVARGDIPPQFVRIVTVVVRGDQAVVAPVDERPSTT